VLSVVVPAHNEAVLLPRGLRAVADAAALVDEPVEVVVVDNRSTDGTADLAREAGALVVSSDARNIAAVRNTGVAASSGRLLVTVDADSVMAPTALAEVTRLLDGGRSVGGGTRFVPERTSAGINATLALVRATTLVARVSGAMFWCSRTDFDAIGGFDEHLLLAEDVEFARRLRAHGRQTGRRFTTLRSAPLTISTRKFDRFGDWHMFRMALQLREIRAAYKGTDPAWVDRYFFDFND